jgi:hypothetical protein
VCITPGIEKGSIAQATGNRYLAFNFLLDMVGFKYLTCSLFVFAAWSPFWIVNSVAEPSVKPCDEIQVTYKVKNTSGSQPNGEIELKFKDDKQTYTSYLFCGDSKNNRLDISETKITELNAGDYNLYVRSKEGCTRHLTIRIK